ASGLLVMPGASGEYDWQGFVPFADMPYLYNPPEGYIATANNKTIGPDYPYYISAYWTPHYRIERIVERLAEQEQHSLESNMAIQNDILSAQARDLAPYLLAAFKDENKLSLSQQASDALDTLRGWDFTFTTKSVPATIFSTWFVELLPTLYKDEMDRAGNYFYRDYLKLGGLLPHRSVAYLLRKGDSPWFDDVDTPDTETRDDIIRLAFNAAVVRLSEESGRRVSAWHWDELHTITHPHDLAGSGTLGKFLNWWLDLNVGPFPFPGSGATVNPGSFDLNRPFKVTSGASVRRIIDFADFDNSRIVLPSGQSGHSLDRHYRDQAELFNTGQYRQVDFSREAVDAHAYSTLILQP
ncbi:MAG: penicillin acylase family protein, partial [Fidelibacterota bacterium]